MDVRGPLPAYVAALPAGLPGLPAFVERPSGNGGSAVVPFLLPIRRCSLTSCSLYAQTYDSLAAHAALSTTTTATATATATAAALAAAAPAAVAFAVVAAAGVRH